ncbi:hypothetical protein CR194_03895 [Salipaludibacillus keqinensis]|uniref:Uncharacterized protein n=1 Tax=Salipaludibacillus keqinensis TaxID=2045207 RepID=A0A323TQ96_9BACI|nr:hypothetical protein [Salipaludibacillus keqinensis]PYZ94683.1 hypothetical protein CR194_03895 [Salipaludibacillus keqinensis]
MIQNVGVIFIESDKRWTTIEEVRKTIESTYDQCQVRTKIELKAWSHHAENSHQQGDYPIPFQDYIKDKSDEEYLRQVELGLLDCKDLGGREKVSAYLKKRIKMKHL